MAPRAYLEKVLTAREPPVGVSLWRHFYEHEFSLPAYVQATALFYETYQWDFLKLNPRSTYYVEAWGARFEPSGDALTGPRMVSTPIQSLADWPRVVRPIPATEGVWAEQLEAIRQVRARLGPEVPLLQTVFAPIEVCSRFLPRKEDLAPLLRTHPSLFHEVFQVITEVLTGFTLACLEAGADGIFFATQWATESVPDEVFRTFERQYDLALLRAVRRRAQWVVLHVCGTQSRVLDMLDYPTDMVHWDWVGGSNPTPDVVESRTPQAIVGGLLGRGLLRFGPPDRVYDYIHRVDRPKRWVVSAECTFPPDVPRAHLMAVRKAVADLRGERWPRI